MDGDPNPFQDALDRASRAVAERNADPEYQSKLALSQENERKRAAKSERDKARAAADDADVPDELGLRTVALQRDPPETEALVAYRAALEFRETQSTKVGRRAVIRLVAGTAGSGKSCGLAWCATHHPRSAQFVSSARIAATPRNGWSDNEKAWDSWLKVDLLCIDEVGVEKGDPASIAYLLSERYNHGLATLMAGNLSRKDFADRYRDERLVDRLRNGQGHADAPTGLPWFVAVTGDSLRNPANAAALVVAKENSDGQTK
jgi:DNA replication protein DnaC